MSILTRERMKETLGLLVHPDTDFTHAEKFWQDLIDTDAALRQRIKELEQERAKSIDTKGPSDGFYGTLRWI